MQKTGKYVPFIMLILAIIFNACASDNYEIDKESISKSENLNSKSSIANVKFSFDTYERFKGKLLDINNLDIPQNTTRLEQNNFILNHVNEHYNTAIDFDKGLKESKSSKEIFNWLTKNTTFNEVDVSILTNFSSNLVSMSFDDAVLLLEEELSEQEIDVFKFEKYQSIVNGVKLIEYQNKGFFTIQSNGWECAFALGKLALASASLIIACNPPALGATVGTACYLAAASFIAASASVGLACGGDDDDE
ncbi:hypothetical protein EB1_05650 [Empedobacter brevis NBRC 14943 = ATCC 43319]|uniref:Lipoprotein n=1 Tax=Empedobacter brevis NBRC 14943 = ATCC 43319 TaxID=1218108 RepID=A0A511ND90_9FLAO|nr:hypothetical protein [Empedobacter brevis]GEM50775.1 hypothetical protein EB1_05650 [Empedobacter brevis NBRC 14943 = ATCC 43319]